MSRTLAQSLPKLEDVVDHAWIAYHAGDWLESFARWERVHAFYPNYAPPYIHGGVSLREAGRLDEALDKLDEGLRCFPDSAELVSAFGLCLDRMGRAEQANDWFESQVARFPGNPEVAADYVHILQRRQDHAGLLRAAALIERIHPQWLARSESMRNMISDARLQIELARLDRRTETSVGPRPPSRTLHPDGLSDRELMLAFQSLGQNCEFGLVQRHFGAEPLGLLRWAAISLEMLTQALDEDFDGVGEPEQTRVVASGGEYATAHARYGMGSHTFIAVDPANEVGIQKRLLTRLAYLRRELLADLADAAKIFVHTCENGATETQIAALHRGLRRHGSRHLLFVRKSNPGNPPASLGDAGDGLMLGYVERLGPDRRPEGDFWNVASDQWAALLRKAARMRAGCA